MSITYPSAISKPSGITAIPSAVERPEFGTLYGFDALQEDAGGGGVAFPVIEVYDTEAEILALTSEPNFTIVHAKDTDKLYVWDGSNWVVYNQN